MPPRPFPYRLRVGIDVCHVSRIRRIVTPTLKSSTVLNRFLKRILTEPERLYFWDRFGPHKDVHTKLDIVSEYLAGRFAAKEAIRKACDHLHKDVRGLHKIIILPIKSGHENKQSAPPQGLILDHFYEEQSEPSGSKVLSGEFTDSIEESHRSIEDLDGQLCEVSISHDNDMATAIALVPSMQKMTSGIGQEIVQDACGRVSPSQEGLQQGHALLSSVHSGDQHAISLANEHNLVDEIQRRTADLSRRNDLVDRICQLRELERTTIQREQELLAEATPDEIRTWRLSYSEKKGLSISKPSGNEPQQLSTNRTDTDCTGSSVP